MSNDTDIIEIQAFAEVSAVIRELRHRGAIHRKLGKMLLDEMIVRGAMEFDEKLSDDDFGGIDIYRGRIKAVAPNAKAWLVERQAEVAKQVAERAIVLIRQWGADFGDAHVSKNRAEGAIRQALEEATR